MQTWMPDAELQTRVKDPIIPLIPKQEYSLKMTDKQKLEERQSMWWAEFKESPLKRVHTFDESINASVLSQLPDIVLQQLEDEAGFRLPAEQEENIKFADLSTIQNEVQFLRQNEIQMKWRKTEKEYPTQEYVKRLIKQDQERIERRQKLFPIKK